MCYILEYDMCRIMDVPLIYHFETHNDSKTKCKFKSSKLQDSAGIT